MTQCPSELSYAVYVDDELTPDERRRVEAHLVGCRTCRELVVALREEAEGLGNALHGRDRAARPNAPAPARGLALGLVPALAGATLAALALGWLLEEAWPAALPLFSPLALGGVYDMAFDLFYMLRDQAPAALEVAVAVVAMASVSALLSFGLTVALRRWSSPTLLALTALLALLAGVPPSEAHFGIHEHRDYELPAGEVHEGTLVAHGESVTIAGVVEGDLLAFTRRLVVRGEVRGSLIAVARDAEISGVVTGTAVVAGRSIRVAGRVGGNLYGYGGERLDVEPTARLERDAAAAGEDVRVEGTIARDLYAGGDGVAVSGSVGRNLHAWAESLRLLDGARIAGDVDAMLPRGESAEVASGAFVGGQTQSRESEMVHGRGGLGRLTDPRTWAWIALHVGAGFCVGLVLHLLLPGLFDARLETAGAFFRSLGLGFAALVLPPLAACLLAFTLIGVPLALMGLLVWMMALYSAFVVVSFLVGRSLLPPRDASWTGFGLTLVVGLVIVTFATHLPYLGGALRGLTLLAGVGLIAGQLQRGWPALVSQPS